MIKYKKKKTHDLNNGEWFKFMNDKENYQVVDYVFYKKEGSKKKILLPQNIIVETFKNF